MPVVIAQWRRYVVIRTRQMELRHDHDGDAPEGRCIVTVMATRPM
jgi:hypothetical protein